MTSPWPRNFLRGEIYDNPLYYGICYRISSNLFIQLQNGIRYFGSPCSYFMKKKYWIFLKSKGFISEAEIANPWGRRVNAWSGNVTTRVLHFSDYLHVLTYFGPKNMFLSLTFFKFLFFALQFKYFRERLGHKQMIKQWLELD